MEKILFVIDPKGININAIDFACFIANLNKSNLTGLLLDYPRHEVQSVNTPASHSIRENYDVDAKDAKVIQHLARVHADDVMQQFMQACSNRGVVCNAEYFADLPVEQLLAETRYADLLVIDPTISLHENAERIPTAFVREVLSHSDCPVLLCPYDFNGIDELVFAYDGSQSSMHALREFVHLFPSLLNKKLTILHVIEKENSPVPDADKIGALIHAHFPNATLKMLEGKAKDELFAYLIGKEKLLVIMGAYGRNTMSKIFRHSTSDLTINTINMPVFIAHV